MSPSPVGAPVLKDAAFVRRIGCGLAGLCVLASSGSVLADPLDEAVQKSLARNPEVRAVQSEVAMATTEIAIARNGYLPSLSAAAGPDAAGVGYDVTLAQTVYDWGRTGSVVDRLRARLAQQQASLSLVRDDVALETVETYLDIVAAKTSLALLQDHLGRLSALAEMARIRLEGRYGDEAEAGRVNLAVVSARDTEARLTGELAEQTALYDLLTGEPPAGLTLPVSPAFLQTLDEPATLDTAIARSPLYLKALSGVDVAEAGLREARAARFPRINVEGSVQRREIGGRMTNDSAIALRLRLDTLQGTSSLERPRLEAQRRDAARWQADAAVRDLRRTLAGLRERDEALAGRIEALAARAAQAEAIRETYREQFLIGRRDIQDLVVMESESFEAERLHAELTIERFRLQYRAAAQVGLLAETLTGESVSGDPL